MGYLSEGGLERKRTYLPPTFGPATAISGGSPPKNLGESVLIPYFIDVTGKEFT